MDNYFIHTYIHTYTYIYIYIYIYINIYKYIYMYVCLQCIHTNSNKISWIVLLTEIIISYENFIFHLIWQFFSMIKTNPEGQPNKIENSI